jgi:hypothetical protein
VDRSKRPGGILKERAPLLGNWFRSDVTDNKSKVTELTLIPSDLEARRHVIQ